MSWISGESLNPGITDNSGTASITVPATCKLAIIVASSYYSGATGVFSGGAVTINSVGATCPNAATDASIDFWQSAVFYLINPATGSQTLGWNWVGSAATTEKISFYLGYFTDVVSSARTSQGVQGGGTGFTTPSIAAQSGDLLIGGAVYGATASGGTWTPTNCTVVGQNSGSVDTDICIASATATGSQTMGLSRGSGADGGMAGIAFIPTGGGPSNTLMGQACL